MRKFTQRQKVLYTLIFICLLGYGWYLYDKHHASAAPSQEAILVEIGKVKRGEIHLQAQMVGTLVAAKNVHLATEVAGKVSEILAYDGTLVKQGTPLVKLDDAVNKVKAESAKANLTYSAANFKRMKTLGSKGAISQQAIDQALADMKEKKAAAEESRVLAEKMSLTAPFEGVLGKIKVSPGEYVKVGDEIVSLTDITNLRVEFNISEKFLGQLKLGQQVTLKTSAYPGKAFYGKIAYIAPTINTEDRTIAVYADVPNQDRQLTAGLFVNVTHLMGDQKNVLLIPAISLVATIDGQQVFKIVDNKAIATAVKIGQRTENEVQVLEGLSAGDTVVITGQHKLRDGVLVKFKT